MSEAETAPAGAAIEGAAAAEEKPHEESIPYEKWAATNKAAKEAKDRARTLEKELAGIRSEMEEREQAGLPELDQVKRDLAKAQKRAEEAETRATETESRLERTRKERWVTAAAKDFTDPDDVVAVLERRGAFDEIESEQDAERAVKRVAKEKKHLLKAEEPTLPGRVLENGQRTTTERKTDEIDPMADAQVLADGLRQFASKQ